MRRSGLTVLFVIAGLTGCSAFSSPPSSSTARTAVRRTRPRHRITVQQGQTVTFRAGAVALPLTLACRKPPDQTIGSGITAVVHTPLRHGSTTYFLGGIGGPSIEMAVGSRGAIRVSCEAP